MAKKIKKATNPRLVIKASRRMRIRNKVEGTAERPRLCVTKSNARMTVQLIDDLKGITLLADCTPKKKSANREMATALGQSVAKAAIAKGIKKVVFDRSGNLYHGRIAALAQGARDGGLEF
jgi:large subunit ribosomal protein L18